MIIAELCIVATEKTARALQSMHFCVSFIRWITKLLYGMYLNVSTNVGTRCLMLPGKGASSWSGWTLTSEQQWRLNPAFGAGSMVVAEGECLLTMVDEFIGAVLV